MSSQLFCGISTILHYYFNLHSNKNLLRRLKEIGELKTKKLSKAANRFEQLNLLLFCLAKAGSES
jgi:hypothetical protein